MIAKPDGRPTIGYSLSSEEHSARDLVRFARRAEQVGFEYASISDHFHPWIDKQGNSGYVWAMLGAIAEATESLVIGTGVTCPTMRQHPAIVAHAAATVAALMPGRFYLGLGTGEYLNEHILGDRWPPYDIRAAMLEEAVDVIRNLWTGKLTTHRGEYFTVENAKLYSLPDEPPPIHLAAGGPDAAELAGRIGDGLINFTPDPDIAKRFANEGDPDRPRFVQLNVCWAESETEARRLAYEICPTVALPGELGQQLATPGQYEQAIQMVTEDAVAKVITCGPDPDAHAAKIQECLDAGYDHVHVYQVGPNQEGFFRFYEREILPRFH
jgi:coenzyme F420-dependent glucose-6-phosphate dehydrogenase